MTTEGEGGRQGFSIDRGREAKEKEGGVEVVRGRRGRPRVAVQIQMMMMICKRELGLDVEVKEEIEFDDWSSLMYHFTLPYYALYE